MPFPHPAPLFTGGITSIWTDFKNAYDRKTLIATYPTGAGPSGWTNSGTTGFATDIVANGGAISGQALRVVGSSGIGNSGTLLWDYIGSQFDAEVLMGVYVDAAGGTIASRQIGSTIRRFDGSNFVIFALFDSTNRDEIETNIAPISPVYTPFSWALDTWYWMRMRCEGNDYKVKVWRKIDPEPSSWMGTLTDSSLTQPGGVGVAGSARASALIYVDFFSVSLDGKPAYGPGL